MEDVKLLSDKFGCDTTAFVPEQIIISCVMAPHLCDMNVGRSAKIFHLIRICLAESHYPTKWDLKNSPGNFYSNF